MKEKCITVGGNKFTICQLDVRQVQDLFNWAKKVMPDPVAEVLETAKMLDGECKAMFLKEQLNAAFERKKRRGSITDAETQEFIEHTVEGKTKLVATMFKKHHPNLTEDEAFSIAVQATLEHGETITDLHSESQRVPVSEEDAERNFFRNEGSSTEDRK